jgi:RNA polymerase sigma-70 factor, ECF subfamily
MAPPPPSFRTVYEAEFDYVWRSLRRLGVAPRDLEDVTQDVFVAVHAKLGRYDPSRPLRPWLFGFAFYEASDYRRLARNARETPSDIIDVADDAPGAEERLHELEEHQLLVAALDKLSPDFLPVFVLHELDSTPVPEIATALGIPLNTCYSRLRLGRKQFDEAARRLVMKRGGSRA